MKLGIVGRSEDSLGATSLQFYWEARARTFTPAWFHPFYLFNSERAKLHPKRKEPANDALADALALKSCVPLPMQTYYDRNKI